MPSKMGCGPMAMIFCFIFLVLVYGGNELVGIYFGDCNPKGQNILDCLIDEFAADEEEEPEEGTVVASGVYTYKGYSITATMKIPLKGGEVTGTVTGTCEGHFKGSYNGQQNGTISTSMGGVCSPLFVNIPASAQFTGNVNKTGKTVPLSFTGRGGGITHEGSMTLSYP